MNSDRMRSNLKRAFGSSRPPPGVRPSAGTMRDPGTVGIWPCPVARGTSSVHSTPPCPLPFLLPATTHLAAYQRTSVCLVLERPHRKVSPLGFHNFVFLAHIYPKKRWNVYDSNGLENDTLSYQPAAPPEVLVGPSDRWINFIRCTKRSEGGDAGKVLVPGKFRLLLRSLSSLGGL